MRLIGSKLGKYDVFANDDEKMLVIVGKEEAYSGDEDDRNYYAEEEFGRNPDDVLEIRVIVNLEHYYDADIGWSGVGVRTVLLDTTSGKHYMQEWPWTEEEGVSWGETITGAWIECYPSEVTTTLWKAK
jgi:hypothetical protein